MTYLASGLVALGLRSLKIDQNPDSLLSRLQTIPDYEHSVYPVNDSTYLDWIPS